MEISKESLAKFKDIYQREYGVILSDSEARELAQRLLAFVTLICRPLPDAVEAPESEVIEF